MILWARSLGIIRWGTCATLCMSEVSHGGQLASGVWRVQRASTHKSGALVMDGSLGSAVNLQESLPGGPGAIGFLWSSLGTQKAPSAGQAAKSRQ